MRRGLIAVFLTIALSITLIGPAAAAPTPTAPTRPTVSVTIIEQAWREYEQAWREASAKTAASGPLSANAAERALPDGWWGWATCLSAVALLVGSNATVAFKVAQLAKKAGSIKAAVVKARAKVAKTPKTQKRAAVAAAFLGVAAEIAGVDAVVDTCFS